MAFTCGENGRVPNGWTGVDNILIIKYICNIIYLENHMMIQTSTTKNKSEI